MITLPMFGTDGVRAPVGQEPMTPETILQLAHATGQLLVEQHATAGRPTVAIGSDTRVSAHMLEGALQAGFSAAGVDTVLCGQLPTPAIAYLTRLHGFQAGVVVTASHNPYQDNGIKFFSAQGDKLSDALEQHIEQRMGTKLSCVASRDLGRAQQLPNAAAQYVDFCKNSAPAGMNLKGLKIVVDTAHGATHTIAPTVFSELGAEVVAVGAAPDGFNINHQVGATAPHHLVQAVLKHQADIGIAFDGDGDRLVMVDSAGRIYNGDELLYVLANHAQRKGIFQGGVVGTVMSNLGLEQALNLKGVAFVRTAVGDRHILQVLKQRGWRLGGENSGHLICLDCHSTGDGIIAALQVLAAMQCAEKTLEQLCGDLNLHAQSLVNVPMKLGTVWENNALIRDCHQRTEEELGKQGRVLLRASGTESVLRVMVECLSAVRAETLARWLAAQVQEVLVSSSMPIAKTI